MDSWLTMIGLGEDGLEGLPPASVAAIEAAEIVMGPARHLALLGPTAARQVVWPVPFADGIPVLLEHRGRSVVVLASGDPFWFGAGRVLAEALEPGEWRAFPGVSVFSLVASRLGWGLEEVVCLGLHAASFARLRPSLAQGVRAIVTMRDGAAVAEFMSWLDSEGFGASTVHVMEALGGPRERVRSGLAATLQLDDIAAPVAVAMECAGTGAVIGGASGKPDDLFDHDGQITKRPVRALTLSALAPRPGERLWDIGAGSGSIALEWMMSGPRMEAVAIEAREDRVARLQTNAARLGQDRLQVVTGQALDVLGDLPKPDVVFVGGGLSEDLLRALEGSLAPGTRLVANSVTLETEALLVQAKARLGGSLLKIALSEPEPLGRYEGWKAAYPVVQWSVVL